MIKKTTKHLSVLSDANIIIDAHRLGIWGQLINQCQMFTTRYIQKNEARYFRSKSRTKSINLKEQISKGNIIILDAESRHMNNLYSIFENWFLESLDAGEREALALILSGKIDELLFCTCDGHAIQALAMINKLHMGISCEKLLEKTGFRGSKKKLGARHSQAFFDKHAKQGSINFVTGTGIIQPTTR